MIIEMTAPSEEQRVEHLRGSALYKYCNQRWSCSKTVV